MSSRCHAAWASFKFPTRASSSNSSAARCAVWAPKTVTMPLSVCAARCSWFAFWLSKLSRISSTRHNRLGSLCILGVAVDEQAADATGADDDETIRLSNEQREIYTVSVAELPPAPPLPSSEPAPPPPPATQSAPVALAKPM